MYLKKVAKSICLIIANTLVHLLLSQGDTLENVTHELDCINKTGHYTFHLKEDQGNSHGELFLEYDLSVPLSAKEASVSSSEHGSTMCKEKNSEQISDFVRKLGFVDKDKQGDVQIKHFLHLYQVSQL